jgi:hypothetical protein
MKCEHVLPSLETGDLLARWRARRHIRHCAECQAAFAALSEFKSSLGDAPPLPPTYRDLWLSAATSETAGASGLYRPQTAWAIAGLAAALVLAAWALTLMRPGDPAPKNLVNRPSPKEPLAAPPTHTLAITGEMAWQQLSDVRANLAALETELDDMTRSIELLDEQQEVSLLLADFDKRLDNGSKP